MRNLISVLAGLVLLASCSTPKYSYNFDYYDYNSGKKNAEAVLITQSAEPASAIADESSPLLLNEEEVTASAGVASPPAPISTLESSVKTTKAAPKKYSDLSKAEKKEFRKALKTELKKYIKAKKSGEGNVGKDTKAMDYNLKMAIIFGAVAVTLSFFGGVNSVFWILSVVSLVIGVVFLVKWLAEQ